MANRTESNQSESFSIGRRQLYILPTRIGWYYALSLVALFAIAVKFDDQAAFMMLFILVGIGNAVMLATHRNVIGLEIHKGVPTPCYAGEVATVRVNLTNHSNRSRKAVYLSLADDHQLVDLAPNESKRLELNYITDVRGIHELPPVVLSSQYPAGLFFVWTKQTFFKHTLTVYPKTKNLVEKMMSPASGVNDSDVGAARMHQGDFQGLRNYQPGDRLRDVHWASYAKNQKLISKKYEAPSASSLAFNWADMPKQLGHEDKLSQLSHWLTHAERTGGTYSLNMPSTLIPLNHGPAHLHECLHVLAEFYTDSDEQESKTINTENKKTKTLFLSWLKRNKTVAIISNKGGA